MSAHVSNARGYEVIIHNGPLPRLDSEEFSSAELELNRLQQQPAQYAEWAADVRARWMRERGIQRIPPLRGFL